MNAHTPGPWFAGRNSKGHAFVESMKGPTVIPAGKIQYKDAVLCAAAHDLLEALQALIGLDEELSSDNAASVLAQARAAIAKAKKVAP